MILAVVVLVGVDLAAVLVLGALAMATFFFSTTPPLHVVFTLHQQRCQQHQSH